MKKKLFRKSILAVTVAAAMTLGFAACSSDDKKDDPKPKDEFVLDGLYFQSEGSALKTLSAKGVLKSTKNEAGQEDRAELREIYIALEAGAKFNIVEVKGADRITYGPGADFAEVDAEELDNDEPELGLQKGAIIDTDNAFTVAEKGLYHVVFDTELGVGSVAKVEWGVIGAATPGGWGASTQLEAEFGLEKMEFKTESVALTKADYKFRYSHGWKVLLYEEGEDVVNVNTNFGGAVDALVPGGDNIVNSEGGYYDVTLTWELGKDFDVKIEKVGDLEVEDYSDIAFGIIGNAYNNADGAPESWGANYPGSTKTPTVDGDVFTWVFTDIVIVEPAADEEGVVPAAQFKFREDEAWDKKSIGFNDVTIEGNAKDNLETNPDGNFVFKEGDYIGTYDITLVIDAASDTYTVTIDKK